jgi:hypothetical protein
VRGLLAGTRRRPAAEDGVPPSLQIPLHTHILTARSPASYSPTTPRCPHSPTALSGPITRPPPSPAHAPCSHPPTGPPDSATSPFIVLYSRAQYARLCVSALPPSPVGFRIWVSTSSLPPHTAHAHTLSLNSYCRPTAGKSSSPAGLSNLVYAYVEDRASASPYTYSSSTHMFPDERTPIEATPLSATSAQLGLGWVWVWDWVHWHTSPRTRSPSSRHPPFSHYPFPPRSLVCGGQTSPHKPRLVVSPSTYPPL